VVDNDRIWFKSHHCVDIGHVDREPGLCASAILQNEPWIIQDARTDLRALSNPLVAGELGLQFYAGIPLRTREGYNLGTLCIIDRQPRTFEQPGPQDPRRPGRDRDE
jgi:GAF domain-containing protein